MKTESLNAGSAAIESAPGPIMSVSAGANPMAAVPAAGQGAASNSEPLISGPGAIVNAEAAGSPIIMTAPQAEEEEEEFQEYMSAGCTAVVPPGARKIYLVMVTVTMIIGAAIVYGIFRLLDL